MVIIVIVIASLIFIPAIYQSPNVSTAKATKSVFAYLPSHQTGLDFTNQINETVERNIGIYDYFYNGAGVACGDFNNDGLTDIFFTANDSENSLYQNIGNLKFKKQSNFIESNENRWSTGVTLVDINQDGLLDIYVCNSGPVEDPLLTQNQLFVNKGDFKFSEEAEKYGIADNSRSSQAVFFDMDNDGDLDLWVLNHSLRSYGRTLSDWYNSRAKLSAGDRKRECNTLYENRNNRFFDISKESGIEQVGFGLGISLADFNEDGLTDVFISNDYFIPDFMYVNNGDKTFSDQIKKYFNHSSYYSMGSDVADFNNDGLPDLAVVDMTPSDHVRNKTLMTSMNTSRFKTLTRRMKFLPQYMFNGFYLNHGKGYMSDIAHFSQLASTDWSWAPLIADFDNDGFKDLFVTTGFYRDTRDNDWLIELKNIQNTKAGEYSMHDYYYHLKKAKQVPISNKIFQNQTGLQFSESTDKWGVKKESFSNGAAYADFDNDGDLDIVVNNLMQEAFLMENKTNNATHYIQFELAIKNNKSLNTNICIHYGKEKQCLDYQFARGYMSHMQALAHFGLADAAQVDSAVFWRMQNEKFVIPGPEINKRHYIKYPHFKRQQDIHLESSPIADVTNILLQEIPNHSENEYNEFENEVLLPHAQSRIGPALAVSDVNGNGLDDFYFGAAKNQTSKLYFQTGNGNFKVSNQAFNYHAQQEDNAALFIDIDNDNDNDLYVASGSSNTEFTADLQDRLYINDGSGNFIYDPKRLPEILESTKAIVPIDWDQDGDLDLFIGGRNKPGRYPESPKSFFLENENGVFKDRTLSISEDGSNLGMITDAIAINIDTDNQKEIIIVGEWMPITILDFEHGQFKKISHKTFEKTTGWWQSVSGLDYDNDGDTDLIVGNIGLNNKFHPNEDKPLHVYAKDFDGSGNTDIVLSKYYNETLVPVRGKECTTEQMPFISEKFETYDAFANASLIDILGESQLNNALHYQAMMFESVLLINEESGFTLQQLPDQAQLFPILDVIVQDLNIDGKMDLILAGNIFDTEVETTPYDAGKGLIMMNEYPAEFKPIMNIAQTGLNLSANVKSLKAIKITSQSIPGFIVGNNNSKLQLFIISTESF